MDGRVDGNFYFEIAVFYDLLFSFIQGKEKC